MMISLPKITSVIGLYRRVGRFAQAEIAVDQPSAMMALGRDAGS
jgi:hypothetical protein